MVGISPVVIQLSIRVIPSEPAVVAASLAAAARLIGHSAMLWSRSNMVFIVSMWVRLGRLVPVELLPVVEFDSLELLAHLFGLPLSNVE